MPIKELDSIPELRDDPSLRDFNDVTTLAKSFRETKAFVGSSIRPPGEGASAEARADFFAKLQKHAPQLVPLDDKDEAAQAVVWERLGRPKDATGYEFKAPDGVNIDMEGLRAVAAKTGMTKAQFQKSAEAAVAHFQQERDKALADNKALRSKWGGAYDQNVKAAASAAAKAGAPDNFVKRIADGNLTSDQTELWYNIGKMVGGEGTEIGRQTGAGNKTVPTPAEARAQIEEILSNPDYFNRALRGTAKHKALVDKMVELEQYASVG